MRIAYCTNIRLPSERAHGHQVAQVCDALVRLGHEVEIFAPYRKNIIAEEYWTYYGAEPKTSLTHVGKFDPIDHPLLPKPLQLPILNALLKRHLARVLKEKHFDVLYTRSPALLPALLATDSPVVLELHQLPSRGRAAFVRQCNLCRLVACLTSPMRDELVRWGLDPAKVIVEGDAVDLARFANPHTTDGARALFGLDTTRTVVGYVGRLKTLGMEKGVGVLLQAIAALKREEAFFAFVVGGPESDKKDYELFASSLGLTEKDVRFIGEIPSAQIPVALAACDALAMPFPDLPHYRRNMSPLKMFEYMAAGKPIITSDLPTVRDVLGEETAVFCKPGDAHSLVESIRFVREHAPEAAKRAQAAAVLVKGHTWEERMKRVLDSAIARDKRD